MRCEKARILMTKRLYEALSTPEGEQFQAHLAACSRCRLDLLRESVFEQELRQAGAGTGAEAAPRVDLDAIFRPTPPARDRSLAPRLAWGTVGLLVVAGGAWTVAHWARVPTANDVAKGAGTPRKSRSVPEVMAGTPVSKHPVSVRGERRKAGSGVGPRRAGGITRAGSPWTSGLSVGRPRSVPGLPVGPSRLAAGPGKRAAQRGDDARYLDGREMLLGWAGSSAAEHSRLREILRDLPPVADDFVSVPLPRLADGASGRTLVDATDRYKKEAAVVDARLFQKLTLQLKGTSLEEFCAALERQTRVAIRASRGIQDEKVTVFVKDRPARELMREVSRLFGFMWIRSGEEGAYKYELVQDLRSQLAEQELRNRDLNAALLALDEKMGAYQPYLGLTPEQIRSKLQNAQGAERAGLQKFLGPQWGGMQVYHRLTPGERAALLAGQALKYDTASARPDRRLPEEWRKPLIRTFGDQAMAWSDQENNLIIGPMEFLKQQGLSPTPIVDWPGASAQVSLSINHSELGEVALQSETGYVTPYKDRTPGVSAPGVLATAQSPSVARPDNAAANARERGYPAFRPVVSFRPEPSCPVWKAAEKARKEGKEPPGGAVVVPGQRTYAGNEFQCLERAQRLAEPHLTSADVWEEVHRKTGLPIVADFYSRLYPRPALTIEKKSVFEALCKTGDELGARWKRDGEYLLCRSTSFFWDKQKEVPNRLLERWTHDATEQGGLPFADLVEMASLSDQQLDSKRVADLVSHCWDLKEWNLMDTPMGYYAARPWLRLLAELPVSYRERARSEEGLALGQIPPAHQQEAAKILGNRLGGNPAEGLQFLFGSRLRVSYAPSAWFSYVPALGPTLNREQAGLLPLISAPVRKEALSAAQRVTPGVSEADVEQTEGLLWVSLLPPGNGRAWVVGRERPVQFRLPP